MAELAARQAAAPDADEPKSKGPPSEAFFRMREQQRDEEQRDKEVDAALWRGAAAAGWSVERPSGAAAESGEQQLLYISPEGASFTSRVAAMEKRCADGEVRVVQRMALERAKAAAMVGPLAAARAVARAVAARAVAAHGVNLYASEKAGGGAAKPETVDYSCFARVGALPAPPARRPNWESMF